MQLRASRENKYLLFPSLSWIYDYYKGIQLSSIYCSADITTAPETYHKKSGCINFFWKSSGSSYVYILTFNVYSRGMVAHALSESHSRQTNTPFFSINLLICNTILHKTTCLQNSVQESELADVMQSDTYSI